MTENKKQLKYGMSIAIICGMDHLMFLATEVRYNDFEIYKL
jgi:hypothetical protein